MSAEVSAAAGLEVALAQDGADAAVIETILILRAERCTVCVMRLPPGRHKGIQIHTVSVSRLTHCCSPAAARLG